MVSLIKVVKKHYLTLSKLLDLLDHLQDIEIMDEAHNVTVSNQHLLIAALRAEGKVDDANILEEGLRIADEQTSNN